MIETQTFAAPATERHGSPTSPPHQAVLRVSGLSVRYGNSLTVRDVDLELYPGETVALVGGSGAGKSTVAKVIAGLVNPAAGSIILEAPGTPGAGSHRVDLLAAPAEVRRTARREVHLLMQDPYASLPPHLRILDVVCEPLAIHRIGAPVTRREAAAAALCSVGLDPERYARRFPHELSGGERQRVAFARAVVTRPAVILADEPTGMLDATLRSEVSALMGNLARQNGTAILHITHDLALAAQSCDRVIVMADGAIVEHGPTSQVLHNPQHSMTQRLLAAAIRGARRMRAA
ncbi:ABC transporter ATP-binding protein [Paeniglutamicibacter sp. Y32M11]|uniref:ABC transporter ATP-binding protein n=1 Tax=Paeniglutamicibacter sp. Y32M11 TaxID=2853258 RepID=UPI001C52EB3B|nr:dipeptide/oligopeptide/nickel ABC transporter ATP-binding protein [Paeniglutamicibacter sp. Y32M11]QXQ11614.1 dipeptide/oligopeptide/nickel ABC transporter ATP-binding protein [Paeniglutamicibacter sp. Y32M11]